MVAVAAEAQRLHVQFGAAQALVAAGSLAGVRIAHELVRIVDERLLQVAHDLLADRFLHAEMALQRLDVAGRQCFVVVTASRFARRLSYGQRSLRLLLVLLRLLLVVLIGLLLLLLLMVCVLWAGAYDGLLLLLLWMESGVIDVVGAAAVAVVVGLPVMVPIAG